jgi:glycosyltransferase involved in cell wall biosynthesis
MRTAEPRPALSFVVPVFNEEGNVAPLWAELTAVARATGRTYELVFVNDGSRDATLERLVELAATDPNLCVVELDGNFGEAAALSAGFATATGEVVVTMDGDGQNDPADVPRLLERLDEGYDAVSGRRAERKEAFTTRVLPSCSPIA